MLSQSNKPENIVDYKELYGHLHKHNAYGYGRLKPWETYKFYENESLGLVTALTNEDINKVSSLYMEDDEAKENEDPLIASSPPKG
jgi:hypothetical protein